MAHANQPPKGFEHLLKKLNVKPEEAVFIDDRVGNLEGPRKLGMHTIQFKDASQLRKELQELGLR